ncbi:DEAD/DEAH box helicase [Paenibacillus thalictri]|uniref:DEAD/DEAH box helicase n=2 Tax=Paenibacillus thalictri TaxID=2527873 RepID=A0A4Q9DSY3_9BACL|nr:DEAD/DEAH box helicase [Paenibacillus thalictri]TBL80014.1 DEAD/DEAH box helicase [Paenibacillus thalictri]
MANGEGIGAFGFHPVLAAWFEQTIGEPTDVQTQVWRELTDGEHMLIAAPTGSGKTLAALMPCLHRIVIEKEAETSEGTAAQRTAGVRLLYATPLKALNNDVHHHLLHFADEMDRTAEAGRMPWPGLTAAVRTGDTPQSTRASMLRQPPDVLITTPESLYLLLTSGKARDMLKTVRQVIVDEIHDLAADRRGIHLSLSLERLAEWCGHNPQRIGVSATQKPLSRVARYLGGWEPGPEAADPDETSAELQRAADSGLSGFPETGGQDADDMPGKTPTSESADQTLGAGYRPRPVRIIESAMNKTFELLVTMPAQQVLTGDKEAVWTPLAEKILQLMEGGRSTIIFVNNRRLCERLTLRLNDHVGYELARSHHGSVAREQRLLVERALKSGELRCLVATSSLELGIDVGHVDLVLQIDAPPSAAAGIQRIGRAGHAVGAASRGAIIARSRGVLAECAVIARLVRRRDIEDIRVPRDALDVLCQHVVAMTATDDWPLAQLAGVLARSDSFRGLSFARLSAALTVLAGYYPFVRPLIEWDRAAGMLRRSKRAAMAAIMGAGTIPQSTAYPVHHAETRAHLGELDEEFIHESRIGDVFQLGTSSWRIQSIQNDRVYVVETANAYSEIPFWRAEAPGRSYELSLELGRFLGQLSDNMERQSAVERIGWLEREHHLDARAAEQLSGLIQAQRAASAVPTDKLIVIERYIDELGQHHMVFHSLLGRRLNRTWQLALQMRLESLAGHKVYANAKDNGIEFVLPAWEPAWLYSLLAIGAEEAERLIQEALPASPLFGMAFRRLAETSLLLPRSFTRMPAWKQRLRCEELLREALPHGAGFPFIAEALRICLYEYLDVLQLKLLLADIADGAVQIELRDSRFPSPLAAQFAMDYTAAQLYDSDAVSHDVQLQLLSVSRELAGELFGKAELSKMVEPLLEDTEGTSLADDDELWQLLKRQGDMSEDELARTTGTNPDVVSELLARLLGRNQAVSLMLGGEKRWICADETAVYARFPHDAEAAAFIMRRYIDRQLYFTASQLSGSYGVEEPIVHNWMDSWQRDGLIEPSPFAEGGAEPLWTSSKAASRIIRKTMQYVRQKTAAVDGERYCLHLQQLQHAAPGFRLSGMEGLKQALEKLQGLFLPLPLWESVVLPSRVSDYRKEWLDLLCASGEIIWIGSKEPGEKEGKIAFFLTEAKELYATHLDDPSSAVERHAELYGLLKQKGASFLTLLSREMGQPPSQVMEGLLELVWLGKVSNDQFAPLRLHGSKSAGNSKPFQSGLGRWYTLDSIADRSVTPEQSALSWVNQLLKTHAVLSKEVAALQPYFAWEKLLDVLKQLEHWGMVTRGLWLKGSASLQFAAPETLTAFRQSVVETGENVTLLCAADPANPYGVSIDWPKTSGISFARKPGNYLVFAGGRSVLWIENNGRRFYTLNRGSSELWRNPAVFKQMLKTLLQMGSLRKLVIDSWDGQKLEHETDAKWLLQFGGERDRSSVVIWPSSLKT